MKKLAAALASDDPQEREQARKSIATGLRTFAADLAAEDAFALDCAYWDEMPATPEAWAAYPTCIERRARIAYFGKTGPGDIPESELDRLKAELS